MSPADKALYEFLSAVKRNDRTCLDGRRLYLRKIVVDEDGSSFFAYTDRADRAKVFSLLDAREAVKGATEFKGVRHNITCA